MESPASASVPRVYVPVSLPDSPAPTYAVLQFLGFSSPPPDPQQTLALAPPPLLRTHFSAPPSSPSPPLKLLPCSLSPRSVPPFPAPKPCSSPSDSSSHSSCEEKEKKLTSIKPSPMKKSASSGTHTSSLLSPGAARRNVKSVPLGGATISITHTDKDTIIHTNSSNFREVVHQLTGAASGKKDLLPVTIPARASVRSSSAMAGHERGALPVASPAQSTAVLSPTTKLLERRKFNRVLERLTTSCRNLAPLVPSPVTPLASDFEKICLPYTPTTSEGSSAAVTPAAAPCTPAAACATALARSGLDHGLPAVTTIPSSLDSTGVKNADDCKASDCVSMADSTRGRHLAQKLSALHASRDVCVSHIKDMQGPSLALSTPVTDAMDMQQHVFTPTPQEVSLPADAMDTEGENPCDGGEGFSAPTEMMTDKTHKEESAIAQKSFFFHSQRPRYGDPTLLSLFPESPRDP